MSKSSATLSSSQGKKQNGFKNFFNNKLLPSMDKLGNEKHLASLRDAFATLIPFIIVSSIAIVLLTVVFGGWGAYKTSLVGAISHLMYGDSVRHAVVIDGNVMFQNEIYNFKNLGDKDFSLREDTNIFKLISVAGIVLGQLNNFGLGLLGIYFVFFFGFFLAKNYQIKQPEVVGILALASFFVATAGGASSASWVGGPAGGFGSFMDAKGLFLGIVLTIFVLHIYRKLITSDRLKISMPEGVPPAVGRAFTKLLPTIIVALSVAALFAVVAIPSYLTTPKIFAYHDVKGEKVLGWTPMKEGSYWNLGDLIFFLIQTPITYIAKFKEANFAIALFFAFLVSLLWFFGLHGTNILTAIFGPVFLLLFNENIDLLNTDGIDGLKEKGSIFTGPTFDAYVFLGGAGSTLALILSTLIFSKNTAEKEVAKFSLAPGVFQINEPVVFGYPMTLNPTYFIPFVFTAPILVITTFLGHIILSVTPAYVAIPWTIPTGLGSLFASGFDWKAPILTFFNFGIAFAIWTPFVMLSSKRFLREQEKLNKSSELKVEVK